MDFMSDHMARAVREAEARVAKEVSRP